MTELKPCPFCGSDEVRIAVTYAPRWYYGECEECYARTDYFLSQAEAVAAWNTRAGSDELYTREDVEGAFVSGYSLGTLPVGSDPQWDENAQTVEEHMAELGWVRERTCEFKPFRGPISDTDEIGDRKGVCSVCSACMHEQHNYCPNCGAKAVER